MLSKRALITGITGQDGSYLSELLLEKGYEVHGLTRQPAANLTRLRDQCTLHYGDLLDGGSLIRAIKLIEPDEIYNLGAQSHVSLSFERPEYTAQADGVGSLRLLEAIRVLGMAGKTRVFQASTSELYGIAIESPQTESTPFHPHNPYGVAKLFAHFITVNYREAHGIFASNGILFNHDSPRRSEGFVSRKVSRAVSRIAAGLEDKLSVGNIDVKRDWGHARDYVQAMFLMLQHERADDFVVASGKQHSVRELIESAFASAGMPIAWHGSGMSEVGKRTDNGKTVVDINPVLFRPSEADNMVGDASKAKRLLGWEPATTFEELVREMIEADMRRTANESAV